MTAAQSAEARPIEEWTVHDVVVHLVDQSWADNKVVEQFKQHEVDGETLLDLTREDLKDMGFNKVGQVKCILRNIRRMVNGPLSDSMSMSMDASLSATKRTAVTRKLSDTHLAASRLSETHLTSLSDTAGNLSDSGSKSTPYNKLHEYKESQPESSKLDYNTPPLNAKRKPPKRFFKNNQGSNHQAAQAYLLPSPGSMMSPTSAKSQASTPKSAASPRSTSSRNAASPRSRSASGDVNLGLSSSYLNETHIAASGSAIHIDMEESRKSAFPFIASASTQGTAEMMSFGALSPTIDRPGTVDTLETTLGMTTSFVQVDGKAVDTKEQWILDQDGDGVDDLEELLEQFGEHEVHQEAQKDEELDQQGRGRDLMKPLERGESLPQLAKHENKHQTKPHSLKEIEFTVELDLDLAKSRGRPHRAREANELQERIEQEGVFSVKPFDAGILEKERRYAISVKIFLDWGGKKPDAYILTKDWMAVLKLFNESSPELTGGVTHDDGVVGTDLVELLGEQINREAFVDYFQNLNEERSPTLFDDLVAFIYLAMGDQEPRREANRRENLFLSLFEKWDNDGSGILDRKELFEVILLFNDWFQGVGDNWLALDINKYDANADHVMEGEEFMEMMIDLTTRFGGDDFDAFYFRISRCIDAVRVRKATGKDGAAQPHYYKKLHRANRHAHPLKLFILHGATEDPSRAVESMANKLKRELKGMIVSSVKGEANAIKTMKWHGIGRGNWIYLIISRNYEGTDRFLRDVAVALDVKEPWLCHKKFRILIYIAERFTFHLPAVVVSNSLRVSLDEKS